MISTMVVKERMRFARRRATARIFLVVAALLSAGLPVVASADPRPTGRILMRGLRNAAAYAAGGRLYVAEQSNAFGKPALDELVRVDTQTGQVAARRWLDSAYNQALLADGSLWVATTREPDSWLWRLDPKSLAVEAKMPLGADADGTAEAYPTMTLAGGWLWVGYLNALLRVSLKTVKVTKVVPVPHAEGVGVSSDAHGRTLVDSVGQQRANIQARNPVDGSLIAHSSTIESVSRPYIGGVFGDGVWISNATGSAGYVERLSLRTLKPTPFRGAQPHPGVEMPPSILGSNGVTARVIDDMLWLTQIAGGPGRNYCGDPITGVARVRLALDTQADFLTADAGRVYFLPVDSVRNEKLAWVPASPQCR
jgi:hypothetical protein